MIEDIYNVKLDPAEVFQLDITDEELIKNARELGWNQASQDNLEEARDEHGFRSDMYLYYALYYGKQEGLTGTDLFSFAGLMTTLICGLGASFGTDTYKKEQKIEGRALDVYNSLSVAQVPPLEMAKVIVNYCKNEYTKPEREKMIPRNVTLPGRMWDYINQAPGNNTSAKLRYRLDEQMRK